MSDTFFPQIDPDFGSVDYSRGRKSPESQKAWEKVAKTLTERQRQVFEFIAGQGAYGATVHEVAEAFGTTPNAVSGRMSELLFQGILVKNGQRRRDAAVVVVKGR